MKVSWRTMTAKFEAYFDEWTRRGLFRCEILSDFASDVWFFLFLLSVIVRTRWGRWLRN